MLSVSDAVRPRYKMKSLKVNEKTNGMEENKWWIPTDFYPNSRLGITPNIWCTHTKLPPDGGGKRFSPPTDGRSLA